jgi:predicted deacylase
MTEIATVDRLTVDIPPRQVRRFRVQLTVDGLGGPIAVPVLVARGAAAGPVLGITAALHGNELNGIPVVQRLVRELDLTSLRGTLVAVPVLNVPGFLARQRAFTDGTDLNRVMPGKPDGNDAEVYAHHLIDRLLTPLHYLIDYHTASTGRSNLHYVRADLSDPDVAELARRQNAQVIVNTPGDPGTLRPFLSRQGVRCLTVELCDPDVFQPEVIDRALVGLRNTLVHLAMTEGTLQGPHRALECDRSYWIYTDRGGLLEVFPQLGQHLARGERIARLTDVFGDVLCEYAAPEEGVVIGKSINPVNQTGGRILHLGIGRP